MEAQEIARHVDSALLKKLEVRRFGEATKKKPRGQKVPAGQSYTKDVVQEDSEIESEEDSEEDEPDEPEAEEEQEDETLPDLDTPGSSRMGSYVVAVYEGSWFLAEVSKDQTNVGKDYTRLIYMQIKGTNSFNWDFKTDIVVTLDEDILLEAVEPQPVNSRGHLGLNKKDLKLVLSRMVVVYFILFLNLFFRLSTIFKTNF